MIVRLRTLTLVLTAGCNLKCDYCYQGTRPKRRMDAAVMRAAIDRLLAGRRREVKVQFYGGEPLLEFSAIRAAVDYLEARRPPWQRVRWILTTNGTLLTRERLAFFASQDFQLELSFDGVPAAQDQRGRGTFRRLDRLLGDMRREHPDFFRQRLRVSAVLTARGVPALAESVAYFLSRDVSEFSFYPSVTHDPEWQPGALEELRHQFRRIAPMLKRYHERAGRIPYPLFRRRPGARPLQRPSGAMCGVATPDSLTVDTDGHTFACATFAGSFERPPAEFLANRLGSLDLGDIRDPRLGARLDRLPVLLEQARVFTGKEKKHSAHGRCRDCRFLDSCTVCPMSIGHIPGNTDPDRVPDSLCAFNLVANEARERAVFQSGALLRLAKKLGRPERLDRLERLARFLES